MKIISFLFIFFLSFNLFAFSINDLKNSIAHENIQGNFQQQKIITGFPKPIITEGKFTIKNKTLFWLTEKPRKSYIKINEMGIFSLSDNSTWHKVESQYDKSMFLDILNFNFEKIEKIFNIKLSGDKNNWAIVMTPKTHITSKIFKDITITGNIYVSSINITEENGDKTIMEFFNVSSK